MRTLPCSKLPPQSKVEHAFTLIEMLVAVGIIALVGTLVMGASRHASDSAKKTKEISAARQLTAAYLAYAAEHDGELLAGYLKGAQVDYPNGDVATGEEANRYPWRMAPYMDWQVDRALMVNEAADSLKGIDPSSTQYRYMVSLAPSLGINGYCVGGYYKQSPIDNPDFDFASGIMAPKDVVTRLQQVTKVSNLVVFASARTKQGKTTMAGNWIVRPPVYGSMKWKQGDYNPESSANDFGNVDFRYGGNAVVAFLDGSARMMNPDQLRDMRYWSVNADSESYSVKP